MRYLLLSILLVFPFGCGEDDGSNPSSDGFQELIPDGFERVSSARLDHSGTRIAMVVDRGGDEEVLITTAIDGSDVKELANDGLSYLSTMAWSADDSQVYFSGDGIQRVPAAGGDVEKVVDAFAVAGFDVSADDKMIAWATNGGQDISIAPLKTIPVDRMDISAIGKGGSPRFSPDGKTLVIVQGADFATMKLDGKDSTVISDGADYLSNAAWYDSKTVLILANDKISKVDISTNETTTIKNDGFAATELDYSANAGKYLYLVNGNKSLKIGSLD